MRAISPHANYSHVLLRPELSTGVDDRGRIHEVTDGDLVNAVFEKSGLFPWEEIEAIEHFGSEFGALPEGVNPITRVSVFDSEAYVESRWGSNPRKAAQMQERIDEALLFAAKNYPTKLRVVDRPGYPKPWASYDEQTPQEIFDTLAVTGTDPADVRLYEAEHENRDEIFEGLDALEGGGTEEPQTASFVVGA